MKQLALGLPLLLLQQGPPREETVFPTERLGPGEWYVHVEIVDEVRRCTILADDAPLHRVLADVADDIEVEVEGLDSLSRSMLVTVELRDRELRFALEYVLGSVGLRPEIRPGTVSVLPDTLAEDPAELLFDRAMVAYLSATSRFPYHAVGARALLSQAEIEERRGNLGAALNRYETLLENFQTNALVPLAMLRTATLLEDLGQHGEAKAWYRDLAGLEMMHGFEAETWLGMARTSNAMREHSDALNILEAMDVDIPIATVAEERGRLFERVAALNGIGEHMDALRGLDELDQLGMPQEMRVQSFALRAGAFEGLDMLGEAGRSWLIHSRGVDGPARQRALENAARLALAEGDEIGVLLVIEEAEAAGLKEGLEPYELEARRSLGMQLVVHAGSGAPTEQLDLAEELADRSDYAQAASVLEELFEARDSLGSRDLARVYRLRAEIVERELGLEPAIDLLRRQRLSLEDPQARALLDVAAGEMYERHGLYSLAADAYRGVL